MLDFNFNWLLLMKLKRPIWRAEITKLYFGCRFPHEEGVTVHLAGLSLEAFTVCPLRQHIHYRIALIHSTGGIGEMQVETSLVLHNYYFIICKFHGFYFFCYLFLCHLNVCTFCLLSCLIQF